MIFTSILRQALVVMISHTPIRSVRTFFLWKLTAMTDLQMGHLILMMPSTASGSASNNLLFLQHGQATCTSCISFRLPQEASQKGMSNWPLEIFYFPLHCLPWLKSYGSDKYSISNMCSIVNDFRSPKKILAKFLFCWNLRRTFIPIFYSAGNVPDVYSRLHLDLQKLSIHKVVSLTCRYFSE